MTEHPMKVALGRLFRREFSDLEMIAFGMAVTVDALLLFAGLAMAMVSAKAWSRQQRRESAKKTKEAVDNILGWMTAMRDAFVQQIQGVEAHAQKVGEGVSQFVKECFESQTSQKCEQEEGGESDEDETQKARDAGGIAATV
jgi:hypothetical protein